MIRTALVLGAGSAGLIAAISLKRKIPQLVVRIVRSPDIGVIGVGESTTPNFPRHLFDYLGISRRQFFEVAQPSWKLGVHFIWGPRPFFNYGFSRQLDAQLNTLSRPNGFYCDDEFSCVDVVNALMELGKAFQRHPNGAPDIPPWYPFHLDNIKLVRFLEIIARQGGVEFVDARVKGAEKGPAGISAIILDDGRRLEADFFIDASGFRCELLGGALEEPFISYGKSLFSDRTIVGNWDRSDEPILPYTTAETMDCGWCWRIDHETTINRGYVYCSSAISDEAAREEFLHKNPKALTWDHVVKFRSGRHQRAWVDNVVAIGNSCAFVEPLESSALMMVCWQCETMITCLLHADLEPNPSMQQLYNDAVARSWDELRDFLALHYRGNTRLQTPFWRRCQEETDLSHISDLLKFYYENGPTGLCRYFLRDNSGDFFGVDGFLVQLVGNRYPYRPHHAASPAERQTWNMYRAHVRAQAQRGLDIREAYQYIRHPGWRWHDEP